MFYVGYRTGSVHVGPMHAFVVDLIALFSLGQGLMERCIIDIDIKSIYIINNRSISLGSFFSQKPASKQTYRR